MTVIKEEILAPITGVINIVYYPNNSDVDENSLILEMESMKMLFPVTCTRSGVIKYFFKEGEVVNQDEILAEIIVK